MDYIIYIYMDYLYFGPFWGGGLTNQMLITAFVQFWLKCHWESCNKGAAIDCQMHKRSRLGADTFIKNE